MQRVKIYSKSGALYVVPYAGPANRCFGVDATKLIDPAREQLMEALRGVLSRSRVTDPEFGWRPRPTERPVELQASGVNTWSAFMRDLAECEITRDETTCYVAFLGPGPGRGLVHVDEPKQLPASCSLEDLADLALGFFQAH